MQRILGARDADIHQPPLLLQQIARGGRTVRQQSLRAADQEHVLELQTLGGMDRGHGHPRVIARNPQRLQHGLPPGLPVVQRRTLPSGIATHPEPQPLTPQRRAHHLLLRVEPRQHHAVLRRHPARRQTGDRRGHAGSLVGVRAVHGAADPHAIPAAGIQLQVISPVRRRS